MRRVFSMVAYEFYWFDPKGGYQIMGVLPERRKDSARVTQESIMHWGKTIFSADFNPKDIFFIQVTMDEKTGRIFRPIAFTITQNEV
jgi:hypothetical protein